MGALKEFYHDQICQKEREATDYDYDYEQYLKTLKPSYKNTLTFSPDDGGYRVNDRYLCSLPIMKRIVTVENYSAGIGHSCHPNIDSNGRVSGMKKLGYWRKDDITVKQKGFIYNVSKIVCTDILDELCLALEEHRCVLTPKGSSLIYEFETKTDYASR